MDRKPSRHQMIEDLALACRNAELDFHDSKFYRTYIMTYAEKEKFAREHPGAHMVLGDFEIKCLHPEKYDL